MKSLLKAVLVSLAVTAGMAIVGIGSCYVAFHDLGEPSFDEVARVPHPSLLVDAVVVETNGGATTAFGYKVFVVERGAPPDPKSSLAWLYDARRNQCAAGANVTWAADSALVVQYLKARSANLERPEWSVGGVRGVVTLEQGIDDPAAPCGGMLYNLKGRQAKAPQPN